MPQKGIIGIPVSVCTKQMTHNPKQLNMYVLIQECGNDFRIESASESKPALRRRLKDRATEYVKNFFFEDNCDETSKAKGRQFLDELKNFSGDYWDDEDDYYHMSWRIVKVQYIRKPAKKKKTIPVVMAFGEEIVGAIDDGQDVKEILDEYAGTDSLVVRKFNTEAEKKAYKQGLIDVYGWEMFMELTEKYNRKLRDAALGKKKEFIYFLNFKQKIQKFFVVMKANERIDAILQHYNINAKVFAERLGMDRPQAIYDIINEKTKTITDRMANKIISVFSDINKSWLLSGEGEMLKDESIPVGVFLESDHKAPLKRILLLLNEEGISLNDFSRCVNSSVSRFNNALNWPLNSSNPVFGNDAQIRGWVDAFCELFPHYSKIWILFGKGEKLTYVAKGLDELKERIDAIENQQDVEKKTLLGILDHLIKENQ